MAFGFVAYAHIVRNDGADELVDNGLNGGGRNRAGLYFKDFLPWGRKKSQPLNCGFDCRF
jgi:hypothetical protein